MAEGLPPEELYRLAIAEDGTMPPAAIAWLQDALRQHLASFGKRSLEECLGIKSTRGERSFARRFAASRQTAAVVDAYRLLAAECPALTPWARCEVLASALAEFRELHLEAWRDGGPPQDASALRRALFDAFDGQVDRDPPLTAAGLYALLKRVRELHEDGDLDSVASPQGCFAAKGDQKTR